MHVFFMIIMMMMMMMMMLIILIVSKLCFCFNWHLLRFSCWYHVFFEPNPRKNWETFQPWNPRNFKNCQLRWNFKVLLKSVQFCNKNKNSITGFHFFHFILTFHYFHFCTTSNSWDMQHAYSFPSVKMGTNFHDFLIT